ncbi:hypothetical protein CERZMDRAFT_86269 [Cercospora zeae-maydis SCOH1-5]|uniref:Uncharacterized protein n=1 Tax=Cercospora zeae-maydis SCOH1-5 TaxID=717836 RepID=A0A6A6F9Y6_9PEZI|nr:hypothetical protein CERZMDRAFT_86269 [Cercospora zeae-maydis SCOH1-5]
MYFVSIALEQLSSPSFFLTSNALRPPRSSLRFLALASLAPTSSPSPAATHSPRPPIVPAGHQPPSYTTVVQQTLPGRSLAPESHGPSTRRDEMAVMAITAPVDTALDCKAVRCANAGPPVAGAYGSTERLTRTTRGCSHRALSPS